MIRSKKFVSLTIPQFACVMAPQKNKYIEMGRGGGKSTIFGYHMRELVRQMPKASFALPCSTYSQALSRTLPSAIEGLEMFNLYNGIDYVIGRSGKKLGFELPYQPPSQWDNIIHFPNGSIFQLVSLDNPNSGRGLNSSAEAGDEAALFDPEKLFTNVKTTNRSQKEIYKKAPLLGSEFYISSTPINKKGKWFTDMEEVAKKNPKDYAFIKASARSNPYLNPDWFKKMRDQSVSEVLYNAEILNIRPQEIVDGFYGNLNQRKHYYTDYNNSYLETIGVLARSEHFNSLQDNDVRVNEPLIVSVDFGVFNGCVVSQLQDDEYRVLKSFFVKSPKLLDDLFIEQFIPYYRPHQEKFVYLYGGHDGNNRLPNSERTYFQQISDVLTAHGWTVYILTKGAAPTHTDKYLLINAMLKEHQTRLPKIRINEHNNPDLIIALERTEARESLKGGIEKVKKDERNPLFPQQHAPHLTDAFDVPLMTMFNAIFKGQSSLLSESRIQSL
ncbi:hypothetical protein [Flavobacterium panacagri]|uniref:hypothetical protein n=1 Tax=Flavobacterium panacagri TaxID=3034146 RepID=UPI0025A62273|nr:hypothetical protein [Flavobacterium panacagri]